MWFLGKPESAAPVFPPRRRGSALQVTHIVPPGDADPPVPPGEDGTQSRDSPSRRQQPLLPSPGRSFTPAIHTGVPTYTGPHWHLHPCTLRPSAGRRESQDTSAPRPPCTSGRGKTANWLAGV